MPLPPPLIYQPREKSRSIRQGKRSMPATARITWWLRAGIHPCLREPRWQGCCRGRCMVVRHWWVKELELLEGAAWLGTPEICAGRRSKSWAGGLTQMPTFLPPLLLPAGESHGSPTSSATARPLSTCPCSIHATISRMLLVSHCHRGGKGGNLWG